MVTDGLVGFTAGCVSMVFVLLMSRLSRSRRGLLKLEGERLASGAWQGLVDARRATWCYDHVEGVQRKCRPPVVGHPVLDGPVDPRRPSHETVPTGGGATQHHATCGKILPEDPLLGGTSDPDLARGGVLHEPACPAHDLRS